MITPATFEAGIRAFARERAEAVNVLEDALRRAHYDPALLRVESLLGVLLSRIADRFQGRLAKAVAELEGALRRLRADTEAAAAGLPHRSSAAQAADEKLVRDLGDVYAILLDEAQSAIDDPRFNLENTRMLQDSIAAASLAPVAAPAPPKPAAGSSPTGTPSAGTPSAGRPAAGKPAATKPAAGKPAATKPAAGKPAATKPAAGKPAGKPAAGKPAAGKPAAGKPGAGKPAAGKPAAGKPAAGKPAAGKPAAKPPKRRPPPAPPAEPTISEPDVFTWIDDLRRALERNMTLEQDPVPVLWREHPPLLDKLADLKEAVTAYRTAPPDTDVGRTEAVKKIRQLVAEATNLLRDRGDRFRLTQNLGDDIPPTNPVRIRPVSRARNPMEGRIARILKPLSRRHMRLASPAKLFDVLTLSDVTVTATGRLTDRLPRGEHGYSRGPRKGGKLAVFDVRGLEDVQGHTRSAGWIQRQQTNPDWLAERLGRFVHGWERAHLIGPGFGAELFAGIMLAPSGVNQKAQNRRIEHYLREAAPLVADPRVTATAEGRRLLIPLADGSFEFVDVLERVSYQVEHVDGPVQIFTVEIEPDGRWEITVDKLPEELPRRNVPTSGTE